MWVMVNGLSLSMLNSALKCRSGSENRPKSPEFHFNVHLATAPQPTESLSVQFLLFLSFFRQEGGERYGTVCKAGTVTDEHRQTVTNDRPGKAGRDNETVKGNGGF